MADSGGFKIFASGSSEVQMPSSNIRNDERLKEGALKDAIEGELVQRLVIPKESRIDPENFIFDFSGVDTVTVFQKEAIKSLLTLNGTVSLYLYKPQGLVKIGRGNKYSLERMVPLVGKYVFNDEIKIYKNYEEGKPVKKVTSGDITQMRLNL